MELGGRSMAPWIVLAMLAGASAGAAERRAITAANRVVAAYEENWGLRSAGAPKLIVAVWDDGHVVWSQDQIHGGPPYYVGTTARTRLDSSFACLAADGVLENTTLNTSRFGPDSTFTTLLVRDRAKQLKMRSWHEVAEASGKLVAMSSGLQALEGRRRADVLRSETPEYLFYRMIWAELRAAVQRLLPAQGQPVGGILLAESGTVAWAEEPRN
jgi:hypothetical protein